MIAVVRNKTLRRFYDPTVAKLETGDQVVVVRHAEAETLRASSRPADPSPAEPPRRLVRTDINGREREGGVARRARGVMSEGRAFLPSSEQATSRSVTARRRRERLRIVRP